MGIEKLKKKRQLNVQEQNALEEYRIFSEASYWRENGLPDGLIKVLIDKNINKDRCDFLRASLFGKTLFVLVTFLSCRLKPSRVFVVYIILRISGG